MKSLIQRKVDTNPTENIVCKCINVYEKMMRLLRIMFIKLCTYSKLYKPT